MGKKYNNHKIIYLSCSICLDHNFTNVIIVCGFSYFKIVWIWDKSKSLKSQHKRHVKNSNSLLLLGSSASHIRVHEDSEHASVKSVFSGIIASWQNQESCSHFFAVHIEVLSVDLDAHDDDLIIPLSSDWCVPQLAHIQGRIYSPNNLWRTNTIFNSMSLKLFCFTLHKTV